MTRRIIVAIDESAQSRAALQAAARLAKEISAEIFAIFIEDADLFSVAALPGRAVVSFEAANIAPLDPGELARGLRVRARRLRQEVEHIASELRVPWHFETARGRVSDELLRVAGSCELIALGSSSFHAALGVYGSTARAVLAKAHCSVLVLRRPLASAKRVVVMTKGSPRAREIGESLAHTLRAELIAQATPESRSIAFDILMRLAPSYLVIDRASLGALGLTGPQLAEQLKIEGLIVTGDGSPNSP